MLGANQMVSLHTMSGVQLYQFPASEFQSLTWSRELGNVSRAEMSVPTKSVDDITPWLHWMSVWDDHDLLWTGPVQRATYNRDVTVITAQDCAALLSRTRVPLTKMWESTDPARIADELFNAMFEQQRQVGRVIVRQDPLNDPFNFETTADVQMLDAVIDDLVGLGLTWSVVAGTVLLGPAPRTSIAGLGEDDFVNDSLSLVRDGTRLFTDVLLRAADDQTRARVNVGGLNLQTIVDVDSLFGVSNADRAARQYLRYCSRMREAVALDGTSQLHPLAPLTIESLVPSARVTVTAYGVTSLMEISAVEVAVSSNRTEVSIGLESVDDDPPELIKITDNQGER